MPTCMVRWFFAKTLVRVYLAWQRPAGLCVLWHKAAACEAVMTEQQTLNKAGCCLAVFLSVEGLFYLSWMHSKGLQLKGAAIKLGECRAICIRSSRST